MRAFLIPILACCIAAPVLAQTAKPTAKPAPATTTAATPSAPAKGGPTSIGSFDDWQAATYDESGQKVCYAFTKAKKSDPKIAGRGEAVLTVTQRASGRDAVALSAGYEYAANAAVDLSIDKAKFDLYTAKRSAFARDGHAVVDALGKGKAILATSPHPQKKQVKDSFSPKGFAKAYDAINKACPPK
jgi:hypothetical protein